MHNIDLFVFNLIHIVADTEELAMYFFLAKPALAFTVNR